MTPFLLVAAGKSPWKGLLGALHPGIVHFPIALLAVGALLELIQLVRKKKEPAPGTQVLAALAAAAAVPASIFGLLLADYGGNEGDLINLHKWFGIASTVAALVAAAGAWKARSSPGSLLTLRLGLIAGSGLVLLTGYLGGELVFEKDHILKFIYEILGSTPNRTVDTADGKSSGPPSSEHPSPPTNPPGENVDFTKEIAPIIKDMCFKCHGGEKVKGKFKMNTKALAMEGGDSGKEILPHKPALSKFYTALTLPADDDDLMPPKKEKARPTKEQIERVKKWIEQGADWPDGFEFKK